MAAQAAGPLSQLLTTSSLFLPGTTVCPPCDNEMKSEAIVEHLCASEFGKEGCWGHRRDAGCWTAVSLRAVTSDVAVPAGSTVLPRGQRASRCQCRRASVADGTGLDASRMCPAPAAQCAQGWGQWGPSACAPPSPICGAEHPTLPQCGIMC